MVRNSDRIVAHMDLDTFFVSVERLKDSKLFGKPVIIGGTGGRGVVSSCSYEARAFGVRSALPMRVALRLCPEAVVVSGDMEAYSKYSRMVTEIIKERAPVFEKSSIDEFYLDLSGMDRFFGSFKWGSELRDTIIRETGLPISMGVSRNKLVSKIATGEAKPNGKIHVRNDDIQPFLDPLPVGKIPGIGKVTRRFLSDLRVHWIYQIRTIPRDDMQIMLGKHGFQLWNKAHGEDESLVIPYREQKSIGTEMTFHEDTIDVKGLRATLCAMAENVAFDMRKQNKMASCITVKIRYSNFDTETMQKRIVYTASDKIIAHKVLEIFEKLYHRRLRVRLIGIRLSELIHGSPQLSLLDDTEKDVKLHKAIDRMKFRYGAHIIMRGHSINSLGRSGRKYRKLRTFSLKTHVSEL